MTSPLRVLAFVAALISAACGPPAGAPIPASPTASSTLGTFTLMDTACQYTASTAQPSGGSATANLSNQTSDRAHFDFWRLDSGHSYAEFAAYVSEAGRRLRSKEPEQGHPEFASLVDSSAVQARATGVLHAGLTTGTYGMACIRWGLAQDAPIDMYPAGPLTVAGG